MSKVILITGASSGIGKETAKHLIQAGYTVYGAARRVDRMHDLVKMGGTAIEMDVTDEEMVQAGVNQVIQKEKRIDVLLNNAGYAVYGAVEDVSLEDARRQFEVNLFGLAAVTKAVLPHMRESGKGLIINVSSMGGKMYTPLGAWYHATKHALEGWSDCLRLELVDKGIDVVLIEPGIINTEFGETMYQPMVERAKGGAYEELTNTLAKATKESYEKPGASSPPSVVAKAVLKAIQSDSPKTRYRIGKMAKPLVWARTYLGDRIFDKLVMSQVG